MKRCFIFQNYSNFYESSFRFPFLVSQNFSTFGHQKTKFFEPDDNLSNNLEFRRKHMQ